MAVKLMEAQRLTEAAGLPRFPLAILPTPLVRAPRLEAALGSPPIWVKRDDLTGFGFAGNKARKLELLVADALRQGCDVLVTGGGPDSNHCRDTAAAARVAGLDCEVVLYGGAPERCDGNLAWMRSFGAGLHFTGEADRSSVDRGIDRLAGALAAAGRSAYAIPRGGATPLGAAAYAEAALELAAQLEGAGVRPEVIVVATGACGTQAGLVAGAAAAGLPWRILGAAVSRPPEECRRRVLSLARGCAALLGTALPQPAAVEVVDARGPGHGVASSEGREAARIAAAHEGLLLDATFTAKAMALLIALIRAPGEAPGPGTSAWPSGRGGLVGGPAVFVHTGGVSFARA